MGIRNNTITDYGVIITSSVQYGGTSMFFLLIQTIYCGFVSGDSRHNKHQDQPGFLFETDPGC